MKFHLEINCLPDVIMTLYTVSQN